MDGSGTTSAPPRRRAQWWRDGPRLPSLLLFAIVASSLFIATFMIFSTVQAERRERLLVAKTNQTLVALRDINRATINAETGQRGYLLTLDRRYLAPYQMGAAIYPAAMRDLRRLLEPEATPRQRQLLNRTERLADAKFAEMAESVSLIDDRRIVDAQQQVMTDEGQDLMVELRATITELESIERSLLTRAADDSARLEGRLLPLLGGLLALITVALVLGLWQVVRTARAEASAANAQELGEARDRADLLARELNHRVKNLFAVVLAIVRMSGKDDPAAKPTVEKISKRIHALVTAHEVTQGALDRPVVDLRDLVETAIAPYCSDSERCDVDGGAVTLRARMAVPLGLVLHELVTNAVKYGAWAQPDGLVRVKWGREGDRVRLTWREESAAAVVAPAHEGFGSMLIAGSAQQIGGSIERTFHANGLEVRIDFPAR